MKNRRLLTEQQVNFLIYESIELNSVLSEAMKKSPGGITVKSRQKCSDRLDPNFLRLFSSRNPIFVKCFADAYKKLKENSDPGIFNKIGRYLSRAAVVIGVKFTARPESWYRVIWDMISFTNNTFFPGVTIICETLLLLSKVIGQFITDVCEPDTYDKINVDQKANSFDFMNNFFRNLRINFTIDLKQYELDLKAKNNNAYTELKGLGKSYFNTVHYLIVFMPITSINLMNGKSIKAAGERNEVAMIRKKLDDLDPKKLDFNSLTKSDISLLFTKTYGVQSPTYENGISSAIIASDPYKYYSMSANGNMQYCKDLLIGLEGLKNLGILN